MSENRCSAHSRTTGQRCKNAPINGTNVCRMHGGSAPQVRAKAEQRILEAADPAAAKIVALMHDKKVPYTVQLAAARDLLDRAGISKTQTVALELKRYERLAESGELIIDLDLDDAEPVPDESDKDWIERVAGPVERRGGRRRS